MASSALSTRVEKQAKIHTSTTGNEPKRRNACDYCRNKKTKCSGEYPSCKTCLDNNITCVYSVQKQMGRPKKRQRTESPEESNVQSGSNQNAPGGATFTGFVDLDRINISNNSSNSQEHYFPNLTGPNGFGDLGDGLSSVVPGLTPDTSQNNTPPFLNLPVELQDTTRSRSHGYMPHYSNIAGVPDQSTAMLLTDNFSCGIHNNVGQHGIGQSNIDPGDETSDNRCWINGQLYFKDVNGNFIRNQTATRTRDLLSDSLNGCVPGVQDEFDFDNFDWSSFMKDPLTTGLGDITDMPIDHNGMDSGLTGIDQVAFTATMNAMATDPLHDSNLGLPQGTLDCTCVEVLSRHLSSMKNMKDYSFPTSLHPLRAAVQAAIDAMDCQQCKQRMISAITQTTMLGSIIMTTAANYTHVLRWIDTEAQRAEDNDEEKRFRLADLNTSNSHLHTGGLGCAAAFNISLSPTDWKKMAKKVIRAEVFGPSEGNECCVYYFQMVKKMENRHVQAAHMDPPPDALVDPDTGMPMGGRHMAKEDHLCLKFAVWGRKMLGTANWDD